VTSSIAVISEIYDRFVGSVDKDAKNIQNHFEHLSEEIATGKVVFK
jgi:hypothetical protein